MYSLSTIENFYLNKAERIDRTLTMVGCVKVKVGKTMMSTLCMFDQCSTDHWILHSIAKKLNAKILPQWRGIVKTISGSEQRELEVYQLSIRKECGNFITLQCYGCDEIAHKPAIETGRYKRLLEA